MPPCHSPAWHERVRGRVGMGVRRVVVCACGLLRNRWRSLSLQTSAHPTPTAPACPSPHATLPHLPRTEVNTGHLSPWRLAELACAHGGPERGGGATAERRDGVVAGITELRETASRARACRSLRRRPVGCPMGWDATGRAGCRRHSRLCGTLAASSSECWGLWCLVPRSTGGAGQGGEACSAPPPRGDDEGRARPRARMRGLRAYA